MMEAGHAIRLWPATGRLPGVEAQVVMVAARREEQDVADCPPPRHAARFHDNVESKDVDVERAHAIDVGRAQVNMPDRDAWIDRVWRGCGGYNCALRLIVACTGHRLPSL